MDTLQLTAPARNGAAEWNEEDFADFNRMNRVLDKVRVERARQRTLLERGAIHSDCADPRVGLMEKYLALGEEVGEVAEAIDQVQALLRRPITASLGGRLAARRAHLQAECIQVAAVACAIAESLEDRQP